MKTLQVFALCAVTVLGTALAGCSASTKSPDVSSDVRKSLDQAGLKDVSVSQDRSRGVITLGGHVAADADKSRAEAIAKPIAGNQVVANEISVLPAGSESSAKKIDSDLDKGIESNLDAALVPYSSSGKVKYSVNNGVAVLSGYVDSQSKRDQIGRVAAAVPNVQQVVNELEVKGQKATSNN
jgi:osmotically-inducible protein OsmY